MRDFDGLEAVLVIYGVPALTLSILIGSLLAGLVMVLGGTSSLRVVGVCLLLIAAGGAFTVSRWIQSDPPPGVNIYTPQYMVKWSYVQWKRRDQALDLMRGPKPWAQNDKPARNEQSAGNTR
jgi:hypothetical protein